MSTAATVLEIAKWGLPLLVDLHTALGSRKQVTIEVLKLALAEARKQTAKDLAKKHRGAR